MTNAAGEFEYIADEEVTFSISGIEIGSTIGQEQLNVFDFFNISAPATELELRGELYTENNITDFDRAANIALLLLSLDNDRDASNGLDITRWDDTLADANLDVNRSLHEFYNSDFDTFA